MESSYGIGVKNRYAVFIGDEEEDPLEIVSKTVVDVKTKTPAEKTSSRVKALNDSKLTNTNHQNIIKDNKTSKDSLIKPKPTDSLQTSAKNKDINTKGETNRNIRQKSDRNPRTRDPNQTPDKPNHISDRQNRPPRPSNDQKDIDDLKNQRNRDDRSVTTNDNRERRERSDSDRRGGRNGRSNGSRRGGGRFGDFGRGKRDLDRHSGSDKAGVKAVDKRDGGGAHNWGKVTDFQSNEETFNADTQELTDRSADETALDVNDTNQETDANANDELTKEVEPKEMTLEEYKQQLEEKRVQNKFNIRKPGEGEDNSQWKKTFILKKKEEEEEVEYEEIEVEEEIRKGRHKQLLDIEINFSSEGREFPRRGGDGRRGGRDRRDRPDRERGDRRDGERGGDRDRPERGEKTGGDRGRGGERRGGDRDGERRGGDRDGERRGGDRDGERGGRGGQRSDRQFNDRPNRPRVRKDGDSKQSAPKVDDWNDFPSLATA